MNSSNPISVLWTVLALLCWTILGCSDNDSSDNGSTDASTESTDGGLKRLSDKETPIDPLPEDEADSPADQQFPGGNNPAQQPSEGGIENQDGQLAPGAGFGEPEPSSPTDGGTSSDAHLDDASDGQATDASDEHCCLQGSGGDYAGPGPYEVTTRDVEVPGNGMYTLFYPTSLEADCPHPIAAWGNGTGVSGSVTYTHFNAHAASWGIVVIASHSDQSISQPFLEAGIEWLLGQNNDSNSEFYQKLSNRAGAAGHSQGGRACTAATFHPNVYAAVSVQGGNAPSPDAAFICLTGVADVARERCTQSYDDANGPAFLADHEEADHMSTPTRSGIGTPAGIQYVRLHTAWYRCFLAYDDNACQLFRGVPCPICNEPGWARIEGKNM